MPRQVFVIAMMDIMATYASGRKSVTKRKGRALVLAFVTRSLEYAVAFDLAMESCVRSPFIVLRKKEAISTAVLVFHPRRHIVNVQTRQPPGYPAKRDKIVPFIGCQNGGVCNAITGICNCEAPFYGFQCSLVNDTLQDHLCSTDTDCLGGTCDVSRGICTCKDPTKYGTLCEHEYNCTRSGCNAVVPDAGTCNSTTELCDCTFPFTGMDCTELPDCSKTQTVLALVYALQKKAAPVPVHLHIPMVRVTILWLVV
ncbi:Inherit from KOG: Notch ligand involved in the mediation of Notch signaling (By similarity) [Seminavis robusta]|uniref:Inherit from KOG: Notch ligand involved in the mediation of Notch signaling By similarity n=1 Tax=Seminavis robusta TaxID=568900 RepID=A0A9N8ELB2_9STRA|nr:Inherit from KOG: Notch ligand involved in the mediation of Notch signaling (By similarity) [Seminavis robusta]|eukprot:Sro1119_g243250.1 Inherit from KOG: Notch ligand involved in the mediation of Notch signaling (By similarity) (255) ;mRNA; r:28432-29278